MRWFAGAALVVFAALWIRVAVSASADLDAAQAAETRRDLDGAVRHYQWAVRSYSPLASAPVKAADALDRLAREAVERGDRARALQALRRLRGGILATRWLLSPFGDRLADVNARLARLTADQQLAEGHPDTLAGRDRDTLIADHAALLALDPIPSPWASLWVVLSFLGWVLGALGFIFKGLDREARVQGPAARRFGALTVLSFAAWVVGLMVA